MDIKQQAMDKVRKGAEAAAAQQAAGHTRMNETKKPVPVTREYSGPKQNSREA